MRSISTCMGYKAAQTLYYAIGNQAERIGLPLNAWVTINFSMTAIAPWDAVPALIRIRNNHYSKWARRPRKGKGSAFEPTYIYVFENKRENEIFGDIIYEEIGPDLPHNVHAHMFMHVPPNRQHDFECLIYEWVDFVAGRICPANTIKVQWVTEDNGISGYCVKGSKHAKRFGSEYKPQGAILGKRAGTSENLGPSARKALDKILKVDRKENMRNFHRAA